MLIERYSEKGAAHNRESVPITLGLDTHLFVRNATGDYVCDVSDTGQCMHLLSISEAFRVYGKQAQTEFDELEANRVMKNAQEVADRAANVAKDAAAKATKARDEAAARQQAVIDKKAKEEAKQAEEEAAIEEARLKQEAEKEAARVQAEADRKKADANKGK